MQLNPSKCTCYFGNVDNFARLYALHISQFTEGSIPVVNLGLPLISSTLESIHCDPDYKALKQNQSMNLQIH